MRIEVYTCTVCRVRLIRKEFRVPYCETTRISPEMVKVIEHEEDHRFNGEEPGWDLKLEEE